MISLITTCDPQRFDLLLPFVDHYRRYGVEAFYVNLHFDTAYPPDSHEAHVEDARRVLASAGLELHSWYTCPFDAQAIRRHHEAIQQRIADQSSWVVCADIDEFHEFPDELGTLIPYLERHSLDYVRGRLVDRLARNGFPERLGDQSPWKLFPLGTDMTRSILRGCVDKVMLARTRMALIPGHHTPVPGANAHALDGIHPVHHFKWDASALSRLRRRLEADWKQRCPWWIESQKAVDWMERGLAQTFAGLRVFDFMDDAQADTGGPHSGNSRYLRRGLTEQETAGRLPAGPIMENAWVEKDGSRDI